jgi:hypothetical protein
MLNLVVRRETARLLKVNINDCATFILSICCVRSAVRDEEDTYGCDATIGAALNIKRSNLENSNFPKWPKYMARLEGGRARKCVLDDTWKTLREEKT